MDQAKQAVKGFMSKAGHHDTTVHETVAPAVKHETVTKKEHENVTTAVDQEIHQDHYHTSVQPIADKEVLPETHHHNVVPVEHRSFEHDNAKENERRLAEERAQFKDTTTRVEADKTRSAGAAVSGEHIHHHVHETIQPVMNKQTIEPHVVHTTVPIHEVHHNAAQHHATSELPPVSMSEYKKQGGVLTGREERYDGFEGEPRSVGGAALGTHTGNHSSTHGTSGLAGTHGSSTHGTSHEKPSLKDKLNPKTDADRDGKHQPTQHFDQQPQTPQRAASPPPAPVARVPTSPSPGPLMKTPTLPLSHHSGLPYAPPTPAPTPPAQATPQSPPAPAPQPQAIPTPPSPPPALPGSTPGLDLMRPKTYISQHTYSRAHPAGSRPTTPSPLRQGESASGNDKPLPETPKN
ncbi:unnamed protein product [Zymoseptoria tritici ST99CH_1A5]|uniref:Allergen n=1 Tax=Zymoseptoria tritici ST99CH_1A5 TaxID=1276529 RepID=A0A1Y6LVM7_ZYMTR|nr:unnamed protein product [Zymoseptoria tritici ST99CH_1A5]